MSVQQYKNISTIHLNFLQPVHWHYFFKFSNYLLSCQEVYMVEVSSYCCTRTTYTQRELFFKNSKRWGLGRQIGLKFFEAFGVFLAKLLALFWHCKSLVHWKMYIAGSFAYNIFWFLGLKHITLKCSQNKVSAVKNLEKSFHTSVFGAVVRLHTCAMEGT